MRTQIFNSFADLSKDFREDFEILWKLPTEQRSALIKHVPEVSKAMTKGDTDKAIDKAVREVGGSAGDVLKALKLLRYIYKSWSPLHDTAEGFLKDLGELSLVPSDKAEDAKSFLVDFLAEVEKDNIYRLEKWFSGRLLPSYQGCSALVDFRAVMKNPFGFGEDEKLDKYEPVCIGFAPVVIVEISRDSGDPKIFQFQCEGDHLQVLIENLQSALKDLKAARKSLPGGE